VPHVRSQEPPASNDGNVKVIVGKTYDELVINNEKDVFVMFHAPWCGHCKQLSPKWDEVGAHFANNAGITIAKVDSTENDTPVDVQGFPTLYFFPAGDKSNPVQYNSERSTEALIKFVNENSKSKLGNTEGKDEL
jgi:protein disulfide-isomerase A1